MKSEEIKTRELFIITQLFLVFMFLIHSCTSRPELDQKVRVLEELTQGGMVHGTKMKIFNVSENRLDTLEADGISLSVRHAAEDGSRPRIDLVSHPDLQAVHGLDMYYSYTELEQASNGIADHTAASAYHLWIGGQLYLLDNNAKAYWSVSLANKVGTDSYEGSDYDHQKE